MLKKKTTKKKYIPNSKEKYMCAKHKKFFNEELVKWKKDIIGKVNASKLEIKAFAEKHWGETFEEQDFADAACIALWNKRRLANG